MSVSFLGSWLVSEYVYNADGSFAGINRQRRSLHRLEDGRIRVTQVCLPDEQLKSHALGRFAGEWVFDLSVNGRARRYHGPDVIGTGLAWGEGVITGRGFWTRLGFNFTSFGLLAGPKLQLTGGTFHTAGEVRANIVGIAVLEETTGMDYPTFGAQTRPEQVAPNWSGSLRRVSAAGIVELENTLSRQYHASGWSDSGGEQSWLLEPAPQDGIRRITSDHLTGLSKQTGHLFEAELAAGGDTILEIMEVLDPAGRHLLGLRKWFTDHAVTHVEFYHLTPE